mmetsp:Transcript_20415/g.29228  ORF Transcript_20415/g.29228 Transcript_20415/m.29228 type:complete len:579 (+) Transcript_20415:37-1773(+)
MPTETRDELTEQQCDEIVKFQKYLEEAIRLGSAEMKNGVYDWMWYFRTQYGSDFMNEFLFHEEVRFSKLFQDFWTISFAYGEAAIMFADYIQKCLRHDGVDSVDEFDSIYGRNKTNSHIPRSHALGLGSGEWIRVKVTTALNRIKNEEGAQAPQPFMTGATDYGFGPPNGRTMGGAPASTVPPPASTPHARRTMGGAPASMPGPPPAPTPNDARRTMGGAPMAPMPGPPSVATHPYTPSRLGTPMKNDHSLLNLGAVLATPRRAYHAEENIHPNPNAYNAGDHDSLFSASFGGLSIGGNSVPSSVGGGSYVQTRKTSTELLDNSALDGIHSSMVDFEGFGRKITAFEEDQTTYLMATADFASAEGHNGLQNFRANLNAEVDYFDVQHDAFDEEARDLKRTLDNNPKAAELEIAKARNERENEVRLREYVLADKLRSEKVEYEAKCRQLQEDNEHHNAESFSKEQAKVSVIENNAKEQRALLTARLAEVEQGRTRNKELKEKNLTLAKAYDLAIEMGFKIFKLLGHVHQSQDINSEPAQKYREMKTRHGKLQRYIEDKNLDELKGLVWHSEDDDDDISL